MKIYLAGKISGTTWRNTIVTDLPKMSNVLVNGKWIIFSNGVLGKHDYVGPYFVPGANPHDTIEGTHGIPDSDLEVYNHGFDSSICLQAIDSADAVFAWIDTPLCHGTIVELTYAWLKKIPVWIAFSSRDLASEMWFVSSTTASDTKVFGEDNSSKLPIEDAPKFFLDFFIYEQAVEYLKTCPYDEYLQSDEWKETRKRSLEFWDKRCCVCNSPDELNVHHRTYENRPHENISDLVVLCRNCHALFHSNGRLQKAQ